MMSYNKQLNDFNFHMQLLRFKLFNKNMCLSTTSDFPVILDR